MVVDAFQTAVSMVYPPRCLSCGDIVESDFGLCGTCWRDTAFIGGAICDTCGVPVMGESGPNTLHCDDCMTISRPWQKGRSALLYKDTGRKLVLALKHGDREEIATPAASWMAHSISDLPLDDLLVAPIPLHWLRLLKRRYNQSALLATALARHAGLAMCPDLLVRTRRTASLDGKGRDKRFATLQGSISVHPHRQSRIIGRPVLLVDDVMTSGATLAAATEACIAAGSGSVYIVTLARVAKDT